MAYDSEHRGGIKTPVIAKNGGPATETNNTAGHNVSNVSGLDWGDGIYQDVNAMSKPVLNKSPSPTQKIRFTNFQRLPADDTDDYQESPSKKVATDITTKNAPTGGPASERSKKIVYQKGVSGGLNSSQNVSRLDFNGSGKYAKGALIDEGSGNRGHKIQQSFDLEEVRDIGTHPIEDESFLINDLS
jgi:hypothetical protein